MVKKSYIKDILTNLIKNTNRIGNYSQRDIERAIMESRGVDHRTLSNWFNVLWKLEYLSQPVPGVYDINVSKIADLDVNIVTHTQVLGEASKE